LSLKSVKGADYPSTIYSVQGDNLSKDK
jgi:hypothetical protein